jgi:hypothetical protein
MLVKSAMPAALWCLKSAMGCTRSYLAYRIGNLVPICHPGEPHWCWMPNAHACACKPGRHIGTQRSLEIGRPTNAWQRAAEAALPVVQVLMAAEKGLTCSLSQAKLLERSQSRRCQALPQLQDACPSGRGIHPICSVSRRHGTAFSLLPLAHDRLQQSAQETGAD